jgi:hypothetical protein
MRPNEKVEERGGVQIHAVLGVALVSGEDADTEEDRVHDHDIPHDILNSCKWRLGAGDAVRQCSRERRAYQNGEQEDEEDEES